MVVECKPGETRTAFCGTVMNITLEVDKQTKGKLRFHLHRFLVTPTPTAVWPDSCGLAHLHSCKPARTECGFEFRLAD